MGQDLLLPTHRPMPSLVQPQASPHRGASPAHATHACILPRNPLGLAPGSREPSIKHTPPHPRPLATAGQPHTLLKGQHVIKSLRSPLALSQAAFSHDLEKEQKGWKLSDLLKTAVAQR